MGRCCLCLIMVVGILPFSAMAEAPIQSASEIEYPPFCIVDTNGRADGFSVELMRAALMP